MLCCKKNKEQYLPLELLKWVPQNCAWVQYLSECTYFPPPIYTKFVSAQKKESEKIMCDQVCMAYTTSDVIVMLLCLTDRKYVFNSLGETHVIV